MKSQLNITIDTEILAKVRRKTDNLSGTVNDLLKSWIETVADKENMEETEQLKHQLDEHRAKEAAMEAELKILREKTKPKKTIRVIEGPAWKRGEI